jgi:hypothetical protein
MKSGFQIINNLKISARNIQYIDNIQYQEDVY